MRTVNIDFTYENNVLHMTADQSELSQQFDNNIVTLVFNRTPFCAAHRLILLFSSNGQSFAPIDVDTSNEFIVPNALTQNVILNMQCVFQMDDEAIYSNVIMFTLRKSLDKGTEPITPIPPFPAEHAPYIGDSGNWFEYSYDDSAFIDTGIKSNGFSPQITIVKDTPDEYILHIKDADHEFDTPNLRGGNNEPVPFTEQDPIFTAWLQNDYNAAAIKALYESNTNTNAFTDAEKQKLADIVPVQGIVIDLKPPVPTLADLEALTDKSAGDMREVTEHGIFYVYYEADPALDIQAGWQPTGGLTDLTPVYDAIDKEASDREFDINAANQKIQMETDAREQGDIDSKAYTDNIFASGTGVPVGWTEVYNSDTQIPSGQPFVLTSEIPEDASEIMIVASTPDMPSGAITSSVHKADFTTPYVIGHITSDGANYLHTLQLQFDSRSGGTVLDNGRSILRAIYWRKVATPLVEDDWERIWLGTKTDLGTITFDKPITSKEFMVVAYASNVDGLAPMTFINDERFAPGPDALPVGDTWNNVIISTYDGAQSTCQVVGYFKSYQEFEITMILNSGINAIYQRTAQTTGNNAPAGDWATVEYVDQQDAKERTYADNADAFNLNSAKAYAETQAYNAQQNAIVASQGSINAETLLRQKGDTDTLTDAKAYTDSRVGTGGVQYNGDGGVDIQTGEHIAVKRIQKIKPINDIQVGDNLYGAWLVVGNCTDWYTPGPQAWVDPDKKATIQIDKAIWNGALAYDGGMGEYLYNYITFSDTSTISFVAYFTSATDRSSWNIEIVCHDESITKAQFVNMNFLNQITSDENYISSDWAAIPILCSPWATVSATLPFDFWDTLLPSGVLPDTEYNSFRKSLFVAWTETDDFVLGDETRSTHIVGIGDHLRYNDKEVVLSDQFELELRYLKAEEDRALDDQNTALLARIAEVEANIENFKVATANKVLDVAKKRNYTGGNFTCTDPLGGVLYLTNVYTTRAYPGVGVLTISKGTTSRNVVSLSATGSSLAGPNIEVSINQGETFSYDYSTIFFTTAMGASNYTPYKPGP